MRICPSSVFPQNQFLLPVPRLLALQPVSSGLPSAPIALTQTVAVPGPVPWHNWFDLPYGGAGLGSVQLEYRRQALPQVHALNNIGHKLLLSFYRTLQPISQNRESYVFFSFKFASHPCLFMVFTLQELNYNFNTQNTEWECLIFFIKNP